MSTAAAPPAIRCRHASGLHAVARTLNMLHRDLLRDEGDDGSAVRTSVINIVAACNDAAAGDAARDDLLQIGTRHPARAIVIVADPDAEHLLEAEVSIHCASGSRHVCTELVRLRVQGEGAYHLTSILTPLLMPDMPVHLWIVGAPPLRPAFSEEAVALTGRIVFDSDAYAAPQETLRLLAEQLRHHGEDLSVSDLAWERTRVWREAVAHSFDPQPARRFLHAVEEVRITSPTGPASTEAWLLLGWMAARLGWTSGATPSLRLKRGPHDAEVSDVDASLRSVELTLRRDDGSGSIRVTRASGSLATAITIGGAMSTERAITVPVRERAALIGEMMAGSPDDHVYRQAVGHAAALAAAG